MLCLLCVNCNHTAKKVEQSIIREIDILGNLSNSCKIKLSVIASNIEYCVLEFDKKCLVTPQMSVYCSKDYIVTIGYQKTAHEVCYVFERKTGNFIRQISSFGRGPCEYTEAISTFWDENKGQVCFLGNNQYIFFNLNGTLSHLTNRFNQYMDRFVAYQNYYIGYCPNRLGNNTIRIAFYDKTGNFIDSIPNYRSWKKTKPWYSGGEDSWLYIFHNNLFFKELFCDTLYQIKNFNLSPSFVFNTNGLTVPYEIQEGGRYDVLASLSNGGIVVDRYEKYMKILEVFEDCRNLYFTIDYRRQLYPAIYVKKEDILQIISPVSIPIRTGRDWKIPLHGFENDLDGGLPFWPQQMISDKEMMCVYTAEELLDLDFTKISDEKLKNVLNSLNEESNPVVAIVTIKD